jgi:polar amino acid transport system substrate-binding protein
MNNMKKNISNVGSIAAIVFLLCIATAAAKDIPENIASPAEPCNMTFILLQAQADVQGSLDDMESDVANASLDLSSTGLEGAGAHEVLKKLLESSPNLIEAVTFNKEGKIMVVECKGCQGGVGADISNQKHIAHILKAKTPALSEEFLTVEGHNATALAYPVFSSEGVFQGGISATFEPDKMLGALVVPRLNRTSYSVFVMQNDGLDVYSSDANQIGNNLLENPLYKPFPSFLALVRRMVDERSGYGTYDFQVTASNKAVVTKEVYWTTTGLFGRDWRLAIYRILN